MTKAAPDIHSFLTRCLSDDEQLAASMPPWPWHLSPDGDDVIADDAIEVAACFALSGNQQRNIADYILRWEPGRVLAELAAKSELLALHPFVPLGDPRLPNGPRRDQLPDGYNGTFTGHCETCSFMDNSEEMNYEPWPCPHVRILALPYSGRPGYLEDWKPAP